LYRVVVEIAVPLAIVPAGSVEMAVPSAIVPAGRGGSCAPPLGIFDDANPWQVQESWEKAHALFRVLSERYDFNDKTSTIRWEEVLDGMHTFDDANFACETGFRDMEKWSDRQVPPLLNPGHFDTREWCRQEVVMTPNDKGRFVDDADGPSQTFYHGTIAVCAYLIIQGGGFIPGENGHAKAKRCCKGCFGSSIFNIASCRGDQTRHLEDDDVYSFLSCPLTLELEAKCAHLTHYHQRNKQVFLVEGKPGVIVPGVKVKALWWNMRFVQNYRRLETDIELRASVISGGGVYEACCGYGRQRNDFQSCGRVCVNPWSCQSEFEKVGRSYMCKKCAAFWR